ncbi:MAG: calcium/sodium antiporter [Acholeplasmataceae bacterium]|nr:calcium/sodium antiporter [Acholeplasmataceae bacterium]
MLTYCLFVIGFFILIKGAGLLVDGASAIADKFKISPLVIGLTIVAFGTSAPELAVNIFASAAGSSEIAIGNIIGSNIANILLILGVSALIYPLTSKKNTVWKEIPLGLLAAVVVGLMANDFLIDGVIFSGLSRIDGLVLLSFFIIFIYYSFGIAKQQESPDDCEIKNLNLVKSIFYIVIGLIGLVVGGNWIVSGAIKLASGFGISESLIGLTVVAIGTSLPELATSAIAAYKKQTDIAIGNVVGSNIFNIFWILGISSVIRPLPFNPANNIDFLIMIIATVILFIIMFIGKKRIIERWQGIAMISIYVAYTLFLIVTR